MLNLKNELPVAVHVASGGDARVRVGGEVVSLTGISSGCFQTINSTRYRVLFNNRSGAAGMVAVGYTSPVNMSNASWIGQDLSQIADDVPSGTTVYFALLSADDLVPVAGGAQDSLHVSYYA